MLHWASIIWYVFLVVVCTGTVKPQYQVCRPMQELCVFVWFFFFFSLVLSRYMEWSVISDRSRLTTWLEKNKWHCWDLLLAHTNRNNSMAASCVHPNRSPGLTGRIAWFHYSISYSRNWGNLMCLLVGYIL